MKRKTILYYFILIASLSNNSALAQIIYSEQTVPTYQLPEILISNNGKTVITVEDWNTKRRPEILNLFEKYMYGKVHDDGFSIEFKLISRNANSLGGKATQKQIQIIVKNAEKVLLIELLVYIPNKVTRPVPLFVGMNFFGNHSTHQDKTISITKN